MVNEPSETRGSAQPAVQGFKVIGVEEHVAFPDLLAKIPTDSHSSRAFASRLSTKASYPIAEYAKPRLASYGQSRLNDMDQCGLSLQILSLFGAVNSTHLGVTDAQAGTQLAYDINNRLKEAVDSAPARYRALAELPFHSPADAVKELHRCVKDMGFVGAMLSGSVGGTGKYLDSTEFDPVLSAFEEIEVPLFIHPGVPPQSVWDTYYSFDEENTGLSAAFGLAGWGWHNEAAVHVLRLVLSGALDRHPKLKIVTGHLGQMIPMMIHRFDTIFEQKVFGFKRSVADVLRSQVWVAVSGMYSLAATQLAIATWGSDRVLFATDYPAVHMDGAEQYLRSLRTVVSPADFEKICHTNAEKLFKINTDT